MTRKFLAHTNTFDDMIVIIYDRSIKIQMREFQVTFMIGSQIIHVF